jgi:hypothetical protein
MLKKYSILFFLLTAYTIVLAHGIIPHHHHDEEHEMEQPSSHHDGNDHDHHDDAGLSHDFGNYHHANNTTDFHQQSDIRILSTALTSLYIIALFDFTIESIDTRPPIFRQSKDHILFLEHTLSPKGLRAPPYAIA